MEPRDLMDKMLKEKPRLAGKLIPNPPGKKKMPEVILESAEPPFVVGPLGPGKSPDGDTTNGICGIINRKMRMADKIEKASNPAVDFPWKR